MNLCMDKYLMLNQLDTSLLKTNVSLLNDIEMSGSECLRLANVLGETLVNLKTSINGSLSLQLACLNFINGAGVNKQESFVSPKLDSKKSEPKKTSYATPVMGASMDNPAETTEIKPTQPVVESSSDSLRTNSKPSSVLKSNVPPKPEDIFITTTRNDLSNTPVEQVPILLDPDPNQTPITNPYDLLNGDADEDFLNQIDQITFNVIVSQNSKALAAQYQTNLTNYLKKHEFDTNEYIGILKDISKIFIAAPVGIILAFPTNLAVTDFSKALNHQAFLKILGEIFGNNQFVFAIDNQMRDNMKQAFLAAKKAQEIPVSFDNAQFVKTNNNKTSLQEKIKELLK